jgi:multidrug efflux system outer membrane protein
MRFIQPKLNFIVVLCVAVLSGCAVGPKYRRAAVQAPDQFRGPAPEVTSPGTAANSVGDLNWESVYQDEQLRQLIRTALERNYDVRIAAERVIAAQAQLGITRADQLPSVGVGASLFSQRQNLGTRIPPVQLEAGSVSASFAWELDFWGKYRKATEAARANLAATEWGRRAVINTLIASVATAYLQLRDLDSQLEITQKTLQSRKESLRLTQNLADGGRASMADVRQAEQLVYTASAAIPTLQQQIEQQENFISTLLGRNPGAIPRGMTLHDQPRLSSVPAGLPSALLERRPDIRQAEEQLIAANAQIGVAKAALFPSISLTGAAGFQSSALTNLFTGPAGIWNAGASLFQPVFEGGRLRNNLRFTESQQRQLLPRYEQTVQNAFRDVSDSLIAYKNTSEAREEQEHLVTAAQDSARLARIRYEAGSAAYLEVLTNETNSYDADLSLSRARLNETLALVQVYSSLGGGWK